MRCPLCKYNTAQMRVFIYSQTAVDKPVGDWISAPSPISFPWQQGSAPQHLYGSIESAIPKNPLLSPNISGLSSVQAEL